ncbi:hypothetical protein GCM10022262_39030 [Georgenia daeguensis]|uniref:Uncharacterized protein n=1 Tax=Georgenia daeguensis TaxID=908355 RepID=A0ABP6UL41_9MICO
MRTCARRGNQRHDTKKRQEDEPGGERAEASDVGPTEAREGGDGHAGHRRQRLSETHNAGARKWSKSQP